MVPTPVLEILFSPIDPDRAHNVGYAISWHGRFMVFSWGVLLPLGVFAARFCKVLPGQNWPREVQNPFWFTWHRILQYAGLAVMCAGLVLILIAKDETPGAQLHSLIGWSVITLASVQFFAAMAKGTGGGPGPDGKPIGDHFTMTKRRVVFERTHKLLGYVALLLSMGGIATGMWIANAYVWMWIAILGWWPVLLIAFVVLQKRGWAVDTYQAIWGTDPSHPGNKLPPIGWGIRRGPPVPFDQTVSIKKRRMAERAARNGNNSN